MTIVALLTSVISVYYYFRLIVVMYMREGKTQASSGPLPWALRVALAVSVVGIFYLGLYPSDFLLLTNLAALPLP
ncbi:MAG: hypothetical protein ABSA70_09730 [Terriglobia bacterium]